MPAGNIGDAVRYILPSSPLMYSKRQDNSVIGANTGNHAQQTKKSILRISSMCISGTSQASVACGGIQEKCQLFTRYQNLNRMLTFRSYNLIMGWQGGAILQKVNRYSRSLQRRSVPPVFWSPFASELLWRETEVVGRVTARIWGTRLAKCPNQNLAALIAKGGE